MTKIAISRFDTAYCEIFILNSEISLSVGILPRKSIKLTALEIAFKSVYEMLNCNWCRIQFTHVLQI